MAHIHLSDIATRAPKGMNKEKIKLKTATLLQELDDLQNLLYAEGKHSILVILQGMDASGKDGAVRNVFGRMNPQGVLVKSFKEPTTEELKHDFLWRIHAHTPEKGMIQIFNRSHYEDILVTRVHKLIDDKQAMQRIKSINAFETLLEEQNDTHILKFYLHVSAEEQHARLEERIQNRQKQWKYNKSDFREAKLWDDYRKMYEDCFHHCNKPAWVIVPSDQNWYKEYIIASELHKLLKSLNMKYPSLKK